MSDTKQHNTSAGETTTGELIINDYTIEFIKDGFCFTVLGFKVTNQLDNLFVMLKVALHPNISPEYVSTMKLNLYDRDRVITFCRQTAFQLKTNETDVLKGISFFREKLEKHRIRELRQLTPASKEHRASKRIIEEARAVLKSDDITGNIEELLKKAGLVTETKNGLRLFLILLSRKFDKPLHVLLQGSHQLCKLLTDTIASVIPESDIHQQTSMSASSLYYTRNLDYWKHKVLHLGYVDKNFKGAVTLMEFIENNVIKRLTTESDYFTKQLYSSMKSIAGPICLMTYIEDEELINRFFQECFVMRIDENETNKAELLAYMKKESAGLIDEQEKTNAIEILKEIQRQIRNINVIIPFAEDLELPEGVNQPLRTFSQMLAFLKTISLLHQHLGKIRKKNEVEYIEATPNHLETSLELVKQLLMPRLDLLGQKQRSVLESLKKDLSGQDRKFKLADLSSPGNFSKSTFYRHIEELKKLGYIVKVGGNNKKGIEYKIAVWNDYAEMQKAMAMLDTQVKKIMQEVSQKIRGSFPKEKNRLIPCKIRQFKRNKSKFPSFPSKNK